jgi:hypothetical protein
LAAVVSRNHEALLPAKLNQARFYGEPDNSFGLAFAPGAVTARHEITEGQRLFSGTGFLW